MYLCFYLPIYCLRWICVKTPEEAINPPITHIIQGRRVVKILCLEFFKIFVVWTWTKSRERVPNQAVAKSVGCSGKAVNDSSVHIFLVPSEKEAPSLEVQRKFSPLHSRKETHYLL